MRSAGWKWATVLVAAGACTAVLAAAQEGFIPEQPASPDLRLPPPTPSTGSTSCKACHTTKAWDQAAFAHDQTGFPLHGAHSSARCKSCHTVDLSTPLPRSCAGCHQDAHAGDLGKQCQGCHTEETWAPLFDATAHRRTNFPLVGRHAFIPCLECHTDMADRKFARTAVNCLGCHSADYSRAAALGIDHVALGFSTNCADCHTALSFRGAHFPEHDTCFQISVGHHSTIDCLTCHTSLVGAQANGMCKTNTSTCSTCHAHACSAMDSLHARLRGGTPLGYQCADAKCYSCHKFLGSP